MLLTALSLHAQEQDRKTMDRLLRPDMTQAFDLRQSSFSTKDGVRTRTTNTKEFQSSRSFISKEYLAKPYNVEKKSWFSSLFFFTKSTEPKGKYEIPNVGRSVDSRDVATREAYGTAKVAETRAFGANDLQYLRRKNFDVSTDKVAPPQDKIVGYTGDLKPMSIDDVRELLNKNK